MKLELTYERKILLVCIAVSILLITIGIASKDVGVLGNTVILSVFILAVPQLFMRYERFRSLKEFEEKFPAFIRDVVELVRSGTPLQQAIMITSKFDYGRLSNEIKKISNQISWGVQFDRVLDQFAHRVKGSRKMYMGVMTLRETYLSGGDVASTLNSIADNTTILTEADKERKSLLSQYVVLMYVISFMFIGIVAAINRLMIPIFEVSAIPGAQEVLGMTNPCGPEMIRSPSGACYSALSCSVCSMFGATSNVFSIDPTGIGAYYISLFFFMSMIISICCGLVAGQISENSLTAGIKHSLIMATITFGSFSILVRLGLLGV